MRTSCRSCFPVNLRVGVLGTPASHAGRYTCSYLALLWTGLPALPSGHHSCEKIFIKEHILQFVRISD
jgi:hypothetical protein